MKTGIRHIVLCLACTAFVSCNLVTAVQNALKGLTAEKETFFNELKKNDIMHVESLVTPLPSQTFDFTAPMIDDGNLYTCWSVNLDTAKDEGKYDGKVLQGLVFTLEEPKIGTVAMWNGFTRHSALYYENAVATNLIFIDYSTKAVIGEFSIPDLFQPNVIQLNKKLKKCEDGKYRLQLNFGSESQTGIRAGSTYNDLCFSEISFWTGSKYEIDYPVGDRSVFDVKGPVRRIVSNSCTNEFDPNGFTYLPGARKRSYRRAKTILTGYGDSEGEKVKLTYDDHGRLISYNTIYEDYECASVYSYDYKGHFSKSSGWCTIGDGDAGTFEYKYDESGQKISECYSYYDWWNDSTEKEYKYYKVTEKDQWGNWLKRTVYKDSSHSQLSGTEERTLFYY